MDKNTIAERMFDAPCRVESIIWIPGACVDVETLPDEFSEEFIESLPGTIDAQLYARLPQLKRYADGDDYPEPEEVAYALKDERGFLVKAATPTICTAFMENPENPARCLTTLEMF